MSKFRSLASQSCASFPYICLLFSYGAILGYQTILIAELDKEDSEIPTSLNQLSWFASLDVIKIAGSIFTGLLMHSFGSRTVALIASLLFTTSFLMFHYSTTATVIFASRSLSSLLSVHPLSAPYISEISEPQFRGFFLATAHLSFTSGLFFSLLLGSLMYWRTIALVNVIFPIAAAVTVLTTPNSPIWLASKGRLNEVEQALCWLRGWVKPHQVQTEFHVLSKIHEKSEFDKQKLDVEASRWQERYRNFIHFFLQRSFYAPLGAMCLIFLVHSFSGMDTMESYATVTFRELNSPIEESMASAIMGAMGIVGNLTVLFFIRRTGKRKLVFFSVIVTGLCLAIISALGFSELQGEYLWISWIALIIAKFADFSGIGTFVYMLPSEIFPSSVRYIGISITILVKMILKSMMNKEFLYAVNAITLPGVFAFFAFVNLIALVTYYFLFPETEGRSLAEIENSYEASEKDEKN